MIRPIALISWAAMGCSLVLSSFTAVSASEPTSRPGSRFFGDAEAFIARTWLNLDRFNDEAEQYWSGGAQLRIGAHLGGGWLVQGDLTGEQTSIRSDDTFVRGGSLAGHLAWRNTHSHLLGFFAGALRTDQDDERGGTSTRHFIGVEGQLYRQAWTFYGQAGWLDGNGGEDMGGVNSIHAAAFGRAVVRYFVDPNLKIEAEISGARGTMDFDNDDVRIIGWGIKLERQLLDRTSVSIGYFGNHYDQPQESERMTEHVVRVGLKIHFSSGTLFERDRTGASLDTPAFIRWSAQSGGPLE